MAGGEGCDDEKKQGFDCSIQKVARAPPQALIWSGLVWSGQTTGASKAPGQASLEYLPGYFPCLLIHHLQLHPRTTSVQQTQFT
jgi:hypothetical protein